MMKNEIIFGIILLIIGFVVIFAGAIIGSNYKETGNVNSVPCYDKHNNVIVGATCYEKEMTSSDFIIVDGFLSLIGFVCVISSLPFMFGDC